MGKICAAAVVLAALVPGLVVAPPPAAAQDGLAGALSDQDLDQLSGRGLSVQNATASVNGSYSGSDNLGLNSVGSGAFANAAGIDTVIQNTGSNVVIQQATIVNVTIH